MQSNKQIGLSDDLATTRTMLANERTFLAYFRSFAVLFSSGFALIKIEMLHNLMDLGYFFVVVSFLLIIIGILRFIYVRRKVRKLVRK